MDREEEERLAYSEKYPGFEGSLQFDFTFELLGERVTRRLKVEYKHTPDEEYYDLRKRALFTGWLVTEFHFYTRPEPGPDDPDQREFDWVEFDQLIDVIPDELRNKINDAIEDQCSQEDARRRERFLKPGGEA